MKVLIIGLLGKEKCTEDNRIRGGGVVGVVKQFTGLRGCNARSNAVALTIGYIGGNKRKQLQYRKQ